MSYKLSIQPKSFRSCWRAYHKHVPRDGEGHVETDDDKSIIRWMLQSQDLQRAYLWTIEAIAGPDVYAAVCMCVRLRCLKRQSTLERMGLIVTNGKHRLSDEQIDRFLNMAQARTRRLLCPPFRPSGWQRLLMRLRLFRFSGDEHTLAAEDMAILALAGSVSGATCGSRSEICKQHGVAKVSKAGFGGALQRLGLFTHRPARVRHPMLRELRKTMRRLRDLRLLHVRLSNVLCQWSPSYDCLRSQYRPVERAQ